MNYTLWDLRFFAKWGQFYHRKQANFIQFWRKAITLISAISGTSVFVALLSQHQELALYLSAAIALLNLFGIVWQLDDTYNNHRVTALRLGDYYHQVCGSDENEIVRLERELDNCYMDDHVRKRSVNASAFNEACSLFGVEKQHWKYIYPHQRYLFPYIWSLPPHEIKNVSGVKTLEKILWNGGTILLFVGVVWLINNTFL